MNEVEYNVFNQVPGGSGETKDSFVFRHLISFILVILPNNVTVQKYYKFLVTSPTWLSSELQKETCSVQLGLTIHLLSPRTSSATHMKSLTGNEITCTQQHSVMVILVLQDGDNVVWECIHPFMCFRNSIRFFFLTCSVFSWCQPTNTRSRETFTFTFTIE